MDKKIVVIAEIAFALVFIVIMAIIVTTVINFGETANADLEGMRSTAAQAELTPYDGSVVSGDTVISTINKLKETKDGLKISYGVYDGYDCIKYGHQAISDNSSGTQLLDKNGNNVENMYSSSPSSYVSYQLSLRPGDEGFINPVDEYESTLLFNTNGVFVGILFELQ